MAFIYQADVWCNPCGRAIQNDLKNAGVAPTDTTDDSSFDSDEYPKFVPNDEEADCPQHCAAGAHCINAITLPGGSKVGSLFGDLTNDGVKYVKEALTEPTEVTNLWQEYYRNRGYSV